MDGIATLEAIQLIRKTMLELNEDKTFPSTVVETLNHAQFKLQGDLYYYLHDTTKREMEARYNEALKEDDPEEGGGKKWPVN